VNLATQTAHFLINCVFGQKICSKKRTSERKGQSENINYEGLDDTIMRGYPPLRPFLPCPNNVNLYLHMVPKYPTRKIHPSKKMVGD